MLILCLDIPTAVHLTAEELYAWRFYKSGFIRDIYFRQF